MNSIWHSEPITNSPVFIRENDYLMPVIRRTDRRGNLTSLKPIEFTFLTVNSLEDAVLRASIESSQRAPLSQRKSKRRQKLALVIRPPETTTRLFLVSQDIRHTPMEGFEVLSRRVGQPGSMTKVLGKTDWEGSIDIPPDAGGLRIILIRRGQRNLKRLPIVPGLYESVLSTLPNDETRLYAQGVLQGFENQIMAMAIQREVFQTDAQSAVENKKLDQAMSSFNKLKELSINDLKQAMSDEEVRLKTLTSDARELDYIIAKFEFLKKILNKQQKESKEPELQQVIQKMRESRLANPK